MTFFIILFLNKENPFEIEDPRRKQQGTGTKWSFTELIFDPIEFFILCPLTPLQESWNQVYEFGEAQCTCGDSGL
jgi:hypothetical protein